MTLEEAVAVLEEQFICVEWGGGDPPGVSPTGESYLTYRAWGIVEEGLDSPAFYTSPEHAVQAWLNAILASRFKAGKPQSVLYWRTKPEIEEIAELNQGEELAPIKLFDIWSRLLISDELKVRVVS